MVTKRRPWMPAIPKGREDWVANRQIKAHFRIGVAHILGHLVNVLAITLAFWGTVETLPLLIWTGLIGVSIAHRALIWRRHMVVHDRWSLGTEMRWVESNAISSGVIFAIGIAWLFPHGSGEQQIFLALVASALIGAAGLTLRTLPRAALTYAFAICAATMFALLRTGSPILIGAAFLLLSWAALVARTNLTAFTKFVERILHERELAASNETVRLLLNDYEEQGSSWLFEVDGEGRLLPVSERFASILELPQSALYRASFASLFIAGPERDDLEVHINEGLAFRGLTVPIMIGTDEHWWSIAGRPSGSGTGFRGVISDVTATKKAEARVIRMAQYDSLTELPNRYMFNRALKMSLDNAQPDFKTALLLVDIDNFKMVNDGYGHHVGDKLLKAFAGTLLDTVSRSELRGEGGLVARLGGDEFAVQMIGDDLEENAEGLAAQILAAFEESLRCAGHAVKVQCSIGIAISPVDGERSELLQRNAGLALRMAKRDGRARWTRFDPTMDVEAQTRLELERDLREALGKDELRLFFQPLVEAETREHIGFEALLRWECEGRGMVMPDQFIPIAEETGLIVPIGAWVIRTAVAEAARWNEPLTVAVNISPIQMRNPNLLGTIIHALADSGLDPARLELEITESVLMNDIDANLALLHKIKDLGVRIALDDFGTGYSSLNYLRTFPFDKIKIDRCFVSELEEREDCRAIVSAVIGLARNLGMTTTAEGVEDEVQRTELAREGCTQLQGYLFGKPAPVESLARLHDAVSIEVEVAETDAPKGERRAA